MDTKQHLIDKYKIDMTKRSPFYIECGRWEEIPMLFRDLGFKVGAEIGVMRGEWSKNLFDYIPDLKMYCIDKWEAYPGYKDFNQKNLDEYYKTAQENLDGKNAVIIKKWSMDALGNIEDESLDFVYIDGNHTFEFVTADIAHWSKKVRSGGIVSGHDFTSLRRGIPIHVKEVVTAWAYCHRIHPWFVGMGNRGKSWMWVKE